MEGLEIGDRKFEISDLQFPIPSLSMHLAGVDFCRNAIHFADETQAVIGPSALALRLRVTPSGTDADKGVGLNQGCGVIL
jgi:hypothetical protein